MTRGIYFCSYCNDEYARHNCNSYYLYLQMFCWTVGVHWHTGDCEYAFRVKAETLLLSDGDCTTASVGYLLIVLHTGQLLYIAVEVRVVGVGMGDLM